MEKTKKSLNNIFWRYNYLRTTATRAQEAKQIKFSRFDLTSLSLSSKRVLTSANR